MKIEQITKGHEDADEGISFSDIVYIQRKMHGLSKKDVAEKAGISIPMLYNYESGKAKPMDMKVKTLIGFSEALRIDISYLVRCIQGEGPKKEEFSNHFNKKTK